MKAMLLAAGKGERMRPLTLHTPKPLLQAGGKPLIQHLIEQLVRGGWTDLVINHAWLGEQLESALGDGQPWGAHIRWSREGEPLETAGGLRKALPLLTDGRDDWFLVVNGDIWTDFDFAQLQRLPTPYPPTPCPPSGLAHLVLVPNPPQHPQGDFALEANGQVSNRADAALRCTFAGISLLHRDLLLQDPGESRLGVLLRAAAEKHLVSGILHTGYWFDIGTTERLARLNSMLCAFDAPQ